MSFPLFHITDMTKIETTSNDNELIFSFLGFKTKVTTIADLQNDATVVLYEGNELLEEVAITNLKNKFSRKNHQHLFKNK